MLGKIRLAIEKRLRDRGITSADMRRILSGQFLLAGAALCIGVAVLHFSVWPLAFGLGAVIAALNLWRLAVSIISSLGRTYTPMLALLHFGGFSARFALTGVALYVLLVRFDMPAIPLLAGLSTVVAGLAVRGASRTAGNSLKEA